MSATQLIDAREVTHGRFEDNSEAFARLNDALPIHSYDPEVQYAVAALYLKLARIHSGQAMQRQHWEDIEGYGRCVCEMIDGQL